MVLDDDYPFRSIDRVVVTVRSDELAPDPALGELIFDAVAADVDDPPIVEVRYAVADERYPVDWEETDDREWLAGQEGNERLDRQYVQVVEP